LRRNVMRVFYRVRCARRVATYEVTRVVFCCGEMERHWGRLIGFGVRGCKTSTSADVNLFTDRAQVGGKTILETTAIAACPWCGETVATISRGGKTSVLVPADLEW
jgi:hypothetical protein